MKQSYLNSERNAAASLNPSKTIRLLLMVLFVGLTTLFSFGQTATFSTPGTSTWVCPVGVTSVKVEAWGSGEAGSGSSGSGGGGAFAGNNALAVTPGASYTIVVGVGGSSASINGVNTTMALTSTPATYIISAQGGGIIANNKGGLAANCTGTIKFSGGDGRNSGFNPGEGGGGSGGSGG